MFVKHILSIIIFFTLVTLPDKGFTGEESPSNVVPELPSAPGLKAKVENTGIKDKTSSGSISRISSPPTFIPQTGLYWNPKRSGHGFDINLSGSNMYLVWYTYNKEGLGTWYLASNQFQGKEWSANLDRFTYDKATNSTTPNSVGTIKLSFFDEKRAMLSWDIEGNTGSEPIELFVQSAEQPDNDLSGTYFDPSDPGWGLTVSSQGQAVVVVAYIYRQNGEPGWVLGSIADAQTNTQDSFSIEVHAYSNGFEPNEAVTPLTLTSAGFVQFSLDNDVQQQQFSLKQIHLNNIQSISSQNQNENNLTAREINQAAINALFPDDDEEFERSVSTLTSLSNPKITGRILGSTFIPILGSFPYQATAEFNKSVLPSNLTYSWNFVNHLGANASLNATTGPDISLSSGSSFGSGVLQLDITDSITGAHDFVDKWIHIIPEAGGALGVSIEGETRLPLGSSATFSARGFGGIQPYKHFRWEFSDGGQAEGLVVSHEFSSPSGSLPQDPFVKVTVTDQVDNQETTTLPIILEGAPGVLRIEGPAVVSPGQPVTYTVFKSPQIGDNIWSTDANILSNVCAETCEVSWPNSGSGFINVSVQDFEQGQVAESTRAVSIESADQAAQLTAKFDSAPATLETNQQGQWDISVEGGIEPYDVLVSWGDNKDPDFQSGTQSTFNFQHVYDEPNDYTVTATVTSDDGQIVTIRSTVTIPQSVTDFSGNWEGPRVCEALDAPFRWTVALFQVGENVSGEITFHNCPGGGRARYSVEGSATTESFIELNGTKTSGRGPLGGSAPQAQMFIISQNSSPSPNFAP